MIATPVKWLHVEMKRCLVVIYSSSSSAMFAYSLLTCLAILMIYFCCWQPFLYRLEVGTGYPGCTRVPRAVFSRLRTAITCSDCWCFGQIPHWGEQEEPRRQLVPGITELLRKFSRGTLSETAMDTANNCRNWPGLKRTICFVKR